MKINVEASTATIGINNAINESMKTGIWGVRLGFSNDTNDSRYEVVLSQKQALDLIENVKKSIEAIEEIKQMCEDAFRKPRDL